MTAFALHRSLDLIAMDHLPQCPTCDELAAPGATVCECGQRLVPRPVEVPIRHGRECPCTACTLALYDEGAAL